MKKLYKISKYSKRVISIFMIILQMRIAGLASNSINFKGVKGYHEIVKSFSKFLEEEEINDIQQIYEYYNYAMWNGYFSNNHELQYSLGRKVFLDNAGMSIMCGDAVCLNYADMLALIFKEMGFNAFVTMCYVDSDKVSTKPIRTDKQIERKVDSNGSGIFDNVIIDSVGKVFGNHAITCVEYNNELYFFDPTNLVYLNKTGFNDISIINGEGKFDIRYFTSLLFENIDIFKIVTERNEKGYEETVLKKQDININVSKLEKFYNSQKENINDVKDGVKLNFGVITIMLYTYIASLILNCSLFLSNKIINNTENKEIKKLFPKLKEYFNEKNIKTEFETLKNYELLKKQIGIKNNFFIDLFEQSINILEILINNRNYHNIMLNICLNHLGYFSYTIKAKKFSNKINKKNIKLLCFKDELNNEYLYDYEIEELLCKDINGEISSVDGKYKYIIDGYHGIHNIANSDYIREKMNQENELLTEEDLKLLRKNKNLRY